MIKSQAWAENPVDTEVENGKYSALHHRVYAEQAKNEAKQARDNATASMNAAAASADSASQSASNALSSANDAELSKQKAYQWAENPENVEVEPGKYSALHWAAKAEQNGYVQSLKAREWADKAEQWAENPENVEVEAGKYSALHHATKAARSEMNAEAAALDAAGSAAEAFGAAAPAWDSGTVYNFPDVVAFTNGHTYRCIGTNITSAPNINGIDNETDWTRITVAPDGFFEIDENGDLMPMITPLTSEFFVLDENGDITLQEVA